MGVIGMFIGVAAWRAQRTTLIPIGDPRLKESLAFENV
jgi:hypothetical protein